MSFSHGISFVHSRLHRAFRNTIGAIHRHRQICRSSKFSLSVSLLPPFLVPCREFKKAVAAHHRQFSVLVTLRHPLYCVGSSWSIVLHYQGGLHCQALQSLQVSVGHLVVNHSLGFLREVGEGFAHLGVNYSVKLSCHLCTGLGM